MEFRRLQPDLREFLITDFDSSFVFVFVDRSSDDQSRVSGRIADQFDDRLMTGQWPPAPVFGNETEHAMFDLVPLASPWWKVTDVERNSEVVGQFLQLNFP